MYELTIVPLTYFGSGMYHHAYDPFSVVSAGGPIYHQQEHFIISSAGITYYKCDYCLGNKPQSNMSRVEGGQFVQDFTPIAEYKRDAELFRKMRLYKAFRQVSAWP